MHSYLDAEAGLSFLKQLMQINVSDACALGLLNGGVIDLISLWSELGDIWVDAGDDLKGYNRSAQRVFERCASEMTWLEFGVADAVIVRRVTTVADLIYPLRGTFGHAAMEIKDGITALERFRNRADEIDANPSIFDETDRKASEARLVLLCEDLRGHLCNTPPTRHPVFVKAGALHGLVSQAWAVPDNEFDLRASSSQDVRDKLGLIHYPKELNPTSLAQSLVLMSFTVQIDSSRLPDRFDPGFLASNRKGAWLVRPTVCHGPNHRFAQRHSRDPDGAAAHYGRTIDISSNRYDEGVPELILVHGEDAELLWHDLRLLAPAPISRPIDSDHKEFLEVIGSRLGHPVRT